MMLMTQVMSRRPRAIRHFPVLFMVLFLLSVRCAKPQISGPSPLRGQWDCRGSRYREGRDAPGALQSAGATFESKLGMVKSSWSKEGTHLRMEVTVPANVVATFALPAGYGMLTMESKDGTAASQSSDASTLRLDGGTYVLHAEATGAASGPE